MQQRRQIELDRDAGGGIEVKVKGETQGEAKSATKGLWDLRALDEPATTVPPRSTSARQEILLTGVSNANRLLYSNKVACWATIL